MCLGAAKMTAYSVCSYPFLRVSSSRNTILYNNVRKETEDGGCEGEMKGMENEDGH